MAAVTFQVLEGLERGRSFADLPTPLTIGREEDNQIRLNDERVSRFHAKVQEVDGRVILTDLESTNGTRVNGHPVKMRVLQVGDQVLIGRCLLLYGSAEQIEQAIGEGRSEAAAVPGSKTLAGGASHEGDASVSSVEGGLLQEELFPNGPPDLPQKLSPVHAAQLSDLLSFVQSRILLVLLTSREVVDADSERSGMLTPPTAWHQLQQLEMQLAIYLKEIAEPSKS